MATTFPCPVCGAVAGDVDRHLTWHANTHTLDGWTIAGALYAFQHGYELAARGDDTPTAKLPPIGETVRRRPPVPGVRELKGAELLRALADEIERDLADEDQADPRPGCFASTVLTHDRECRWPGETPCLAYGVEGCGMKAQES